MVEFADAGAVGGPGGGRQDGRQAATHPAQGSDGTAGNGAGWGGPATGFSPPTISLPKGGGAIRGLGEKFAANPVTCSLSVPIYTGPRRAGFGPQLSLSYDSAADNGPFGFGWSLSLPSITRKTDKGLPRYEDADESDVFILSGPEDLVPVLRPDGGRFEYDATAPGYTIRRYRPRIERLFVRIECWTRQGNGEVHWHSIPRDNVLTIYGRDENSHVTDPDDPRQILTWMICFAHLLEKFIADSSCPVSIWPRFKRTGRRGEVSQQQHACVRQVIASLTKLSLTQP